MSWAQPPISFRTLPLCFVVLKCVFLEKITADIQIVFVGSFRVGKTRGVFTMSDPQICAFWEGESAYGKNRQKPAMLSLVSREMLEFLWSWELDHYVLR